ncbi:MFS transporter [Amycolatopsis panacis]|uniref:MFS transporter n=1 Tax=Amycolatopsis panacis TaxID=2340917 RepID=A0A419I1R3_9PSEU|nr:MFS transporter [Amycolatopsis panacis]RJQ83713.1 MFS transporter [Amycolatopsis panacis]
MTGCRRAQRVATLLAACLAELMVAVDLTVLHLAIPALTVQLDASTEALLWIADIYGFVMGGLLITMGNLGDRFGRRRVLLAGVTVFAAASVLAAYAPTAGFLIAARALLGVAGSAVLPSATSLLRAVFTGQRARARAVGISSGVSAAGFAIGPICGGLLLDHFWWGAVFLVNVPVTLLILLAARFVPESRTPGRLRLDPRSVLLSVVGMVAVIYALKGAFHAGPSHPEVWLSFLLGAGALLWFGARQNRLEQPLIDLGLFRRRAFSASVGSNLVSVFTMSAFALISSQYFQLVLGWSPLKAGLGFVPGALAALLTGGLLAAIAVERFGRAPSVAAGLALAAAGFTLFGFVQPHSVYPLVLTAQVAFGAGAGLTLTVTGDTILGTVPRDRAGAASAISATAYELGGALGIAVMGSVVSLVYRQELRLPGAVGPDLAEHVRESFGATAALSGGLTEPVAGVVRAAASEAFVGGIRVCMFGSAAVLAVLAAVALVTLRTVPKVIEADRPAATPLTTDIRR